MDIYLVGGAVRDKLLGQTPTDFDYVVVGATEEDMEKMGFKRVGKAFPVFLHPETRSEYALARKEIKKGKGHKAFIFEFAPTVTLEEDLIRRDLTINAMAMDETSNKVFDPYEGKKDLESKVLRHVSPHFVEDPLRVLRVARFNARFPEFSIEPSTLELMKNITRSGELKTLSSERILEELSKAFLAPKPSLFFEILHSCEALKELFPFLETLKSSKNNTLDLNDWDYSFKILDLAKTFDFSLDLLFSVFFMVFGKSPKKNQRERDIKKLETFLENLRFPQKARQLCLETARNNEIGHRLLESSPKEILDLLKKLKAFHQGHTMLPDYLKCIEIESKILYGNEESSKIPSRIFYLIQELKNLNTSNLESKFQGKELGEAIDEARKELITSIIQKP